MDETSLSRDDGTLRLTVVHSGEPVMVTPAFPLTDPDRWLSIRTRSGEEVALIEDPATLPESVRTLLRDEVRQKVFVPRITQVHRIAQSTDGLHVSLETDRGATTIVLESDEHIRRLPGGEAVLVDRQGIRYLIPDLAALDAASRHRLERFH